MRAFLYHLVVTETSPIPGRGEFIDADIRPPTFIPVGGGSGGGHSLVPHGGGGQDRLSAPHGGRLNTMLRSLLACAPMPGSRPPEVSLPVVRRNRRHLEVLEPPAL